MWDPQAQCAIQRLEMVQRRAARYVLRRYHNTSSVSDMLDHLQWPTLAQRRCCTRLILLYKVTHQLVAIPPNLYLNPHPTNTRSNSLAYLPFLCNTNSYKYSFSPRTVCQWNSLPEHIACAPSAPIFKSAVAREICSLPSLSI